MRPLPIQNVLILPKRYSRFKNHSVSQTSFGGIQLVGPPHLSNLLLPLIKGCLDPPHWIFLLPRGLTPFGKPISSYMARSNHIRIGQHFRSRPTSRLEGRVAISLHYTTCFPSGWYHNSLLTFISALENLIPLLFHQPITAHSLAGRAWLRLLPKLLFIGHQRVSH